LWSKKEIPQEWLDECLWFYIFIWYNIWRLHW
jgi:hypothetical protein